MAEPMRWCITSMQVLGFRGRSAARRVVDMKPTALVLLGHPDPRSLNAELARAYVEAWRAGGEEARLVDLTRLAFDPVLRGGHTEPQPLEPDLLELRAAFESASHVVWVFPIYWGAPPAIVRGLIDRLFLPGWAFRYRGHALPEGLLRGRSSRVITTMDSPGWWYALAHRWSLHAVMGTATLSFSGFAPVDFTLLHGVREMDAAARSRWVERVARLSTTDARRVRKLVPGRASPELVTGL
ncbi:MAG: NAD(P)H-dependent oxidoreductase [Polyangiaceae bacterium]